MKVIKKFALLKGSAWMSALLVLSACGGGGGGESGSVSGTASGSNGSVSGSSGTQSDAQASSQAPGASDSSTAAPTPVAAVPAPVPAPPPAAAPPSVPVAANGAAVSGDIVNASGQIDPAAYVAMAGKLSTDAGIAYRYGNLPGTQAAATTTTWYKRTDTVRIHASDGGDWQVGGPDLPDVGDYFQNWSNMLFVADAPTTNVGVGTILTAQTSFNTFTQRPQLAPILTRYSPVGGLDDSQGAALNAHFPVAQGRCYGRPGWCVGSIIAYQNGLISTAYSSNTASNSANLRLPANKVPTAVAVTNSSEFALVTVWDTSAMKGQIAVIALAGLCEGCTVSTPNKPDYWGEWGAAYPGMPNLGNIAFMKLVGFVDLPESVRAPTEISVTTGWNPWDGRPRDANNQYTTPYKFPITNETNRQTFVSGNNTGVYPRGGMAIVASKSEKRVSFVDLKPLFDYYRSMYFGARTDFDKTANVGTADNQWPFALPESAKPKVVNTLDLGARPTAVKATLWGDNLRAWVATQEGNLRFFDINGYGHGTGTSSFAEVGRVAVGPNPTSISYYRATMNDMGNDINNTLLVLSRADRMVRWVDFSADHNSATVRRNALADSRIVDPVMIEDNGNHGTAMWVLSMADYGGKAIRNFRYGPVIFWSNPGACQPPNGCGLGPNNLPASQYPFEYGGDMTLPGKPFVISTANVP